MSRNRGFHFFVALMVCLTVASAVHAQQQERSFFAPSETKRGLSPESIHINPADRCLGPIARVLDVGYEGVKTTAWNWSAVGGGGDSGRFDPTPVLSNTVDLEEGTCLNAHFSAIVGSRQTYGSGISRIAMFQVTLTPATGAAPQHMFGHYDTPYGTYGPAVAIEAERDVDTFGANFFQSVGFQHGDVPPGTYKVDVWWAGGPIGGGGAIGGAFVLKLYQR